MRAITVRQPWAWAIVHGGKDVENRTRNIAGGYRGLVAIHAALKVHEGWPLTEHSALINGVASSAESAAAFGAFGAVIGVVDLTGVHWWGDDTCHRIGGVDGRHRCSPWAMDHYRHLTLANRRPLATPVPAKGRLGLWTLPDDVEAAVLAQLGAVA